MYIFRYNIRPRATGYVFSLRQNEKEGGVDFSVIYICLFPPAVSCNLGITIFILMYFTIKLVFLFPGSVNVFFFLHKYRGIIFRLWYYVFDYWILLNLTRFKQNIYKFVSYSWHKWSNIFETKVSSGYWSLILKFSLNFFFLLKSEQIIPQAPQVIA